MAKISIVDLELYLRVGVTEQERAQPQRLLVTVEMSRDVMSACLSDRIDETINYQEVADGLLGFGEGRSWNLIEKLAGDIADWVLEHYGPETMMVEVKKFVIAQARFVSVSLSKERTGAGPG